MSTDPELLRRYVHHGSQPAFAEVVQRHLHLVYFAALRQLNGDEHRAREVAQGVFTDLARKAASLANRATLTGWLFTSTRFAATKLRRAEAVRQHYEQEATTMNALLDDSDSAIEWTRLRPLIDDAIDELNERDREAVLLRFFQNRPFPEIGAVLRLSDDAARMRVERALEKLRTILARRGIDSTTAALATTFAQQAGATMPAGLAHSIAAAALAGSTAAGVTALGTGLFMSTTPTLIVSCLALAAAGSTFYQWNRASQADAERAALTLERDHIRAELVAEQRRAAALTRDVAGLRSDVESLKARQATLRPAAPPARAAAAAPAITPEQMRRSSLNKMILNNLRQIAAAADRFKEKNGRPPHSIHELVGENRYIWRLVSADGEDYSALAFGTGQPFMVKNSDGETVMYEPSAPRSPQQVASNRLNAIKPSVDRALAGYRATHPGAPQPPSPQALIPFFATAEEGADFVEAMTAMTAAAAGGTASDSFVPPKPRIEQTSR